MDRLSPSSQALLDMIAGRRATTQTSRWTLPSSAGPTLVLVDDPRAEVDALVELIDNETSEGRALTRRIRRRERRLGLADDGVPMLEGRACCFTFAKALNGMLHRLRLPSEHACPECGRRWRIENRVREERRHV